MTATTEHTTLARGTRVRVREGATFGVSRSPVGAGTYQHDLAVDGGPDRDGDYFLIRVDGSAPGGYYVHADFVEPVEERPADADLWGGDRCRVIGGSLAMWGIDAGDEVTVVGRGEPIPYSETNHSLVLVTNRHDEAATMTRESHSPEQGVLWIGRANIERIESPEPTPEEPSPEDMANTLRAFLAKQEEQWEALNERCNALAENEGWCPDYERAVQPHGLEGRNGGRRCYDVRVTATLESVIDSPSSDFDSQWESEINSDVSVAVNQVTARYEIDVDVHLCGVQGGEEGARNEMHESHVESALNEIVGVSFTIEDYRITDIEESDD